jgi:hypothetical protein
MVSFHETHEVVSPSVFDKSEGHLNAGRMIANRFSVSHKEKRPELPLVSSNERVYREGAVDRMRVHCFTSQVENCGALDIFTILCSHEFLSIKLTG